MPIKPHPMRIECPKCGWSMVFAPPSDALPKPPPSACPKCHNPDLKHSPAGALEGALDSIGRLFK